MAPVFSYRDNLNGKVHNFTPVKGKVVITYKHSGISAPKDIKELNSFVSSVPALKSVNASKIMKIPSYVNDSFKGAPDDPLIKKEKERVPVVGTKSAVGFALVTSKDADHDAAMSTLANNGDIVDFLESMTDELGNTRYFVPGYFTIQLNPNYSDPAANDDKISELGYKIMSKERTIGYYVVEVPDGKDLFTTIGEANGQDGVRFAEPFEFGTDEALSIGDGKEYKIFNPGDPTQAWGLSKINASAAWNIDPNNPVRGSADVIIVTIDSGAKLTHQDLDGNLLAQGGDDWDFTGSGAAPNDTHGQGTAIAGVAAAESNALGSLGLSNLGKFMPLKINLTGASPYTDRYNAIKYIGANVTGKAVVNASTTRYVMNIGWKMASDVSSIHSAITEAYGNNVLIVCGAGNTKQSLATNPMYPAVYSEVIPVGATEDTDGRWNDTSKGAGIDMAGSNYGTRSSDTTMVLGAPGKAIRTTKYSSLSDNVYEDRTGTAVAAAFVSGLAALVWQLNKRRCSGFTWNNATVRSMLLDPNNCVNISAISDNSGKINYRIDAQQVLEDANTRACS